MKLRVLLLVGLLFISCSQYKSKQLLKSEKFEIVKQNAVLANEALVRSENFVYGWLDHADPATGLIPRNLTKDSLIWNAKDAAADNYPFMVLTASFVDRNLLKGTMLEMLYNEKELTSRVGNLPDTYNFKTKSFNKPTVNMVDILFGSSEYVKDGLLPLTEWMGKSPWADRMIDIVNDIWKYAPVDTKYGKIPSENQELNGEMLQVLSRLYWMTGNAEYLEYAERLGNYYLFDHHPTDSETKLRLRDHGCEVLSGLTEFYYTISKAAPEKKAQYTAPIHRMLDRVLEVGRNEHGMLYNTFNPQTGENSGDLCDTWGYNYNGFYTVYLVDHDKKYRDAVLKVLSNLNEHYRNFDWENNSADGFADAIESGLNLYNREPVPGVDKWMDNQTQIMWTKQQENGIVEGWHGDGNFARTSIMYALWKTQGTWIFPWRKDVLIGAEKQKGYLLLSVSSTDIWDGKILFDRKRHQEIMHIPDDYPRINQFPEWFTVDKDKSYRIATSDGESNVLSGNQLLDGFKVTLTGNEEFRIIVRELN